MNFDFNKNIDLDEITKLFKGGTLKQNIKLFNLHNENPIRP